MRKLLYFFFLLATVQTYSLAGCCCVPGVSCASVIVTMEKAKAEGLKDVSFNDNDMGKNWISSVDNKLKEIKSLNDTSLETRNNITNLEFANVIESYNEEFLYLSLIDYKKASFDEDSLKNKLLLLEANIDQVIKKSKDSIINENIVNQSNSK